MAWGSLLWKLGPLRLASPWSSGGPALPIEFARVGDGGELATVICKGAAPQPTWWASLVATELAQAREELREREAIDPSHPEWMGEALADTPCPAPAPIHRWLLGTEFDAVIWTALPPKFRGLEGRAPTEDEAVVYLNGLSGHLRDHAEDYVRRVPASIDTPIRRAVAAKLAWTPRQPPESKVLSGG